MNALTQAILRSDRTPHAIVIGSGFGGLAAAIRLGARGYRVTVLERLPEPGGRASVFRQDGFTFDAGPTIVTAPDLLEELWALCGRHLADDVELRPVDPFYRIRFHDGPAFDYRGNADAMRAEIARFAPDDVDGYDRFMVASEQIYRVGFERLGDVPFLHWTDMARIAPKLLRLGGLRSVHSLVSTFVKNERLRTILSFHPLLVGGNPFSASAIYALIAWLERKGGVHFAMGGTGETRSRHGRADPRAGQPAPLQRRSRGDHRLPRRRHRRPSGRWRDPPRRPRRVERRRLVHLHAPDRPRASPPLDRPQDRARAPLHGPRRLVFRHQPPLG